LLRVSVPDDIAIEVVAASCLLIGGPG